MNLQDKANAIGYYVTELLAVGTHTSRAERNVQRISRSWGIEVAMAVFPKNVILTVTAPESGKIHTSSRNIPARGISFRINKELSALSWRTFDNKLSVEQFLSECEGILSKKQFSNIYVAPLAALANASFCYLFGGDWTAMFCVFLSTLTGFTAKIWLHRFSVNDYIAFVAVAMLSSMMSALSFPLGSGTPDVALATSVLFLVPGVLLINGIIDVVEGHALMGFSRLIKSTLLIISLAIGLAFTLSILQNNLL
ncbi:MAG: threonine/serine exporter family protein [Bacteroidales bacterium]|nr:threonine/serine exporter family protein [Bacteroidales bacterium]